MMKVKKIPTNFKFEIELTNEEFTEVLKAHTHFIHLQGITPEDFKTIAPAVMLVERIVTSRVR